MKNRPTNHPSDKSPNATREALNQEQAVSQALLRSFEATRSPWWTTVSAGVLALGLGVMGVQGAGPVYDANVATGGLTLDGGFSSSYSGITNFTGTGPVTLTLNQGAFSLRIFDGAPLKVLGVIKATSGILTLSGANEYTGGTELRAGQLRAGASTSNGPQGQVLVGPFGTGAVTLVAGQLSGANGATLNNLINVNDGATTVLTLGTESDSRDNSNANTELGNAVPIRIENLASLNLNGNVVLTDNARFKVLSSVKLGGVVFDAAGGGAKSITKSGEGVLRMSSASAYSGGTVIEAGELRAESDSKVFVASGVGIGSLQIANTSALSTALAAPTTLNLVQDPTISVNSGTTLTFEDATGISVGQAVVGPNILPGTTVASVDVSVVGANFITLTSAVRGSVTTFAVTSAVGPLGTGKITMKGGKLSGDGVTVGNALDLGVANGSGVVSVALGRGGANQGVFSGGNNSSGANSVLTLSGATTIQQTANITVEGTAEVDITGQVSGKGFTKLGDGILYLANYAANTPLPAGLNSYGLNAETVIQKGILGITDKTDLGNSKVKFTGGIDGGITGGVLDVSAATNARQTAVGGAGYDIASVIESIDVGQTARIVAGAGVDPVPGTRAVFATGLSGKGGLSLEGGELQVANTNSYTGATTVQAGGVLILPTKDAIASSSNIVVKGTLDGSANGFAFSAAQPVEVKSDYDAATNVLVSQGVLLVKDGTSFANANLAVDIANRLGAPQTAGPSIVQTGVAVAGSSSAIPNVTVKVVPRAVYVIGVEQVESSEPVYVKDYFTAEDTNGAQITDRTRIGAVTGTLVSARPIFKLNWVKDGDALTYTRQSYGVFGQGQNGANFGAYLDKQISATSTATVPTRLRVADSTFTEGATFTRFLNETSAQPFADMYRSGLGRSLAVLGGLEDRINSLATSASEEGASRKFGYKQVTPAPTRAAAPVASTDDEWAAWLSVYERESSDKALASDGASKLKNSETGTQMGVERRVGNLKMGLTGATGWGRSTFDTPSTQISSDSWHVGLYAIAPINQLTLDASFMYGLVSNTSTRTPHTNELFGSTAADASYHAKFDSRDLSLSIGAAYNLMEAGSAFQMAPVLRLTYVNYSQSAFSETETGAAAYKVDKMDAGTFLSKLGYRVSYTTRAGSAELGADLGAYWQHDWDNGGRSVEASLKGGLAGTSYAATGRRGSSDSCLINGGLQITFSDKYTLRGSAGAEFGGDRNDLNGTVTFGIKF